MDSTTTYDCPTCEDYGFKRREDGVFVECECRVEKARQLREKVAGQMWENAGIPKRLLMATLDDVELNHADTKRLVDAARAYSPRGRPFLVLCGSNGNGKSHAAAAVAHTALEEARRQILIGKKENAVSPVMWAYCPMFVEQLRRGQFEGEYEGKVYFDLIERACTVEMLVLDDFGLYKESAWKNVQMDTIIGVRYDAEKATIITTNLLPTLKARPELRMPDRLRSRVMDKALSTVVITEAPDYRATRKG